MFIGDGFREFGVVLLGLSAITCGTVLLAGLRRRQHLLERAGGRPVPDTRPHFVLGRTPFASDALNVALEICDVLTQMGAEAAGHLVQLEYAVQPDLVVHSDRLAFRAVLGELVGDAVRHAPGGRVLLSAISHGGRVELAVIDDGAWLDTESRQAAIREIAPLVALQGGSIDVESHAGEGTAVLIRLPEAGRGARVASLPEAGRGALALSEAPRRGLVQTDASPQPEQEAVGGPT